ncbi:MAG: hypothetical protein JXB34_00655 [Bacteroidales bacterium]|nr:hypothetical protein [Bacteroidales bacterium]
MMRMAKYPLLTVMFLFFVANSVLAQKELFIKQIDFELNTVSDIEYENEYFVSMKFNKGSKYIFRITNGVNDRPGEAILEILDADNLVLTNILGEKYFEAVTFLCNKTEFYDVLVKFKDNRLGYCKIDVMLVQ